jgi:hypothetical protein
MTIVKEQEIIRLWNRVRLLQREGERLTPSCDSSKRPWRSGNVQLDYVRSEIERIELLPV